MLSYLAVAGTLASLLTSTAAAPINGLDTRADAVPDGVPRQIRWLKTTPESPGQAAPGEYCLQVGPPGFSTGIVNIGGCFNASPGESTSGGPGDLQLFYYNLGATKIRVFNPDTSEVQCVDFGDNPSDGSSIRLAQCVDNAPGQNLYITDDLHIAVENGPGQCLDVQAESGLQPIRPYGVVKSVQSWSCSSGNDNQIFIFSDESTPSPTPEGEARQIRWLKTTPESSGQAAPGEYCLQVSPPGFYSGTIDVGYCRDLAPGQRDNSGNIGDTQFFYYNLGSTQIKVFNPETSEVKCVDFGDDSTNGGTIRINACSDNAPGQRLFITDDLHIAVENGPGQCLDVKAESGLQPIKPYGAVKSVQSWTCDFGNQNQIFIFPNASGPTPPPTPVGEAKQIRWIKTTPESPGQAAPGVYCLQVSPPGFSTGTIDIGGCFNVGPGENTSGGPGDLQLFYYNLGATQIKVFNPDTSEVRCVDFGDNPTNGGSIRINACSDNAPGQKLYITDDLHIAVENGPGQCLDVRAESGLQPIKPYGAVKSLQSWTCDFGNENQIFDFVGSSF
ncbi:hypothetical protein NliqN6_0967 [Naganishia liquefaciens]|uniref:Ricin B lectin domain-containing protein n=1 Tax=Naganishia liquefaciens TaxID=104408 RepID=A0A8H3YCP8_9TREE|nr:hypothetical protein NliqN6_0967 [Naganishia liquefaciens]